MGKKLIFVSGGARSGKSSFVQNWAIKNGNKVLFIATAERSDEEMSERIDVHINSRPQSWETIEIPLNISKSLKKRIKNLIPSLLIALIYWPQMHC